MPPGAYNLDLYKGDSNHWQIKLWEDEAKTDPVNLAGATARAQIRDKAGGSMVVPLACTVTTPNIIDIRMAASDWSKWTIQKSGVWDLEITYATGDVQTVLSGVVNWTADVTA